MTLITRTEVRVPVAAGVGFDRGWTGGVPPGGAVLHGQGSLSQKMPSPSPSRRVSSCLALPLGSGSRRAVGRAGGRRGDEDNRGDERGRARRCRVTRSCSQSGRRYFDKSCHCFLVTPRVGVVTPAPTGIGVVSGWMRRAYYS